MKRISEVLTECIDEELNATYVDVYEVGSEEGTVAAVVCMDTGKVFYRDYIWASYEQVTTAIQEVVDQVKKPVTVIKVEEGRVTDVVSNTDQEFIVADLDVECCEEDRLREISIRDKSVKASIETDFDIEINNAVSEQVISQLNG